MKKEWLTKTLALCVVVLFVSISYHPIIAENTTSVGNESDYSNVDFEQAKEYLFQTIIEIANNSNVKNLFEKHNPQKFTSNYDFKSVFLQLLFKKPRLIKSMIFTKPAITSEYLETNYKRGIKMVDILGKEESLEIVDSISISNQELIAELNNIVLSNKELSNRILVLGEINNNVQYNLDFGVVQDIFCIILFFCFLYMGVFAVYFGELLISAEENHRLLLAFMSASLYLISFLCVLSIYYLIGLLDCDIVIPPQP